jgi:hypothetical protein
MTKTTARPRPTAVFTCLDTDKKEHIPRKRARSMFSVNIEANRIKRR